MFVLHLSLSLSLSLSLASHLPLSFSLCLSFCLDRLGMYRDAEGQFLSALRTNKLRWPHQKGGTPDFYQCVDMYLYLCKVYVKLDQPLKAVDYYRKVGKKSN